MTRRWEFYFGFSVWLAMVTFSSGANPTATAFSLDDQFGDKHRISFESPRPHILIFADREGSKHLDDWIRPIYDRYGEQVNIHGVAVLTGAPALLRPVLRTLFRRSASHPILLDWTGSVSAAYDYAPRKPDVFVIGPGGTIRHRVSAKACPDILETCLRRIDALLESP